jgi:hypothetical protein
MKKHLAVFWFVDKELNSSLAPLSGTMSKPFFSTQSYFFSPMSGKTFSTKITLFRTVLLTGYRHLGFIFLMVVGGCCSIFFFSWMPACLIKKLFGEFYKDI